MDLSLDLPLSLGLLAFGWFLGVISGFFGVGGGAFLVPALVRLGGLGWPAANGLSLTQMIPTSATGAWQRWKRGEVHPRLAAWCVVGSIPGAWLGRASVGWLERGGDITILGRQIGVINIGLTFAFSSAVGVMGARMLREGGPGASASDGRAPISPALPPIPPHEGILLGTLAGFTSSLLGIGGGFVFVPIAIGRFRLSPALAVGTSLFQMPITAAVGALLYGTTTEAIPYLWLIPLLCGSLAGVGVGTRFSGRFDARQYRRILGGMLIFVSLFLAAGLLWRP